MEIVRKMLHKPEKYGLERVCVQVCSGVFGWENPVSMVYSGG